MTEPNQLKRWTTAERTLVQLLSAQLSVISQVHDTDDAHQLSSVQLPQAQYITVSQQDQHWLGLFAETDLDPSLFVVPQSAVRTGKGVAHHLGDVTITASWSSKRSAQDVFKLYPSTTQLLTACYIACLTVMDTPGMEHL